MSEDFGVRWIAAEMLALALQDLSSFSHDRKADAREWIKKDSGETFGFKWCIATSGVSGNLIRTMVNKIENEGKTFLQLKRYMR